MSRNLEGRKEPVAKQSRERAFQEERLVRAKAPRWNKLGIAGEATEATVAGV